MKYLLTTSGTTALKRYSKSKILVTCAIALIFFVSIRPHIIQSSFMRKNKFGSSMPKKPSSLYENGPSDCDVVLKQTENSENEDFIISRNWFHSVITASGAQTNGYDPTITKLKNWALNATVSFSGKSVIDVGAYDGALSFSAASWGAKQVLATDEFMWARLDQYHFINFCMLRKHYHLEKTVQYLWSSVENLSQDKVGTFDIVIFAGVLYHAPDPFGYLVRVREIAREVVILETQVDGEDLPFPMLAFYHGDFALNNDITNYFGPNSLAVEQLALKAGFSRVVHGYRDLYTIEGLHTHGWIQEKALQRRKNSSEHLVGGRAVFYLYV